MNFQIDVSALNFHNIALLSPVNEGFDSLIRSLFKGDSDELLHLKPFMTVISNNSTHTVVAYAVDWTIKRPGGTQVMHDQRKYPDAVAATAPERGKEILPGERKIDAMSVEIHSGTLGTKPTEAFYLRQFANWFDEYSAGMTELRIVLDAVIFEDGLLIGPDRSDLHDHFAAYLKAKQDLYRRIVESLDTGHSVEDTFRSVTVLPEPESGDEFHFYRRLATEDAARCRRRHGDQAVRDIFEQALRAEPSIIRRQPVP